MLFMPVPTERPSNPGAQFDCAATHSKRNGIDRCSTARPGIIVPEAGRPIEACCDPTVDKTRNIRH
jgi:hypothetical protein